MKNLIHIVVFLLICLLFMNADGCGENNNPEARWRQKRIKEQKDSIRMAFTSETLAISNLKAFGESAKIKFSEFSDYYKILTDTSLGVEFRQEARKMIRKLFISDECMLNFTDITSKQKYKITLSLLLSEDANFILSPLQFQADSIWVQEELSGVSDTHYIGELGLFSDKLISGHQLISDKNKIGKVTINAMKQQKIFGQDTLKTWDVFLGDIHLP